MRSEGKCLREKWEQRRLRNSPFTGAETPPTPPHPAPRRHLHGNSGDKKPKLWQSPGAQCGQIRGLNSGGTRHRGVSTLWWDWLKEFSQGLAVNIGGKKTPQLPAGRGERNDYDIRQFCTLQGKDANWSRENRYLCGQSQVPEYNMGVCKSLHYKG